MYREKQMTTINTVALIFATLFLLFSIQRGFEKAESELAEKRYRLSQMNLDTLGNYIVSRNSSLHRIDRITSVQPAHYEKGRLTFTYHVEDGLLYRASTAIADMQTHKKHVQKELTEENCRKSAHRIFLEKGGAFRYDYYRIAKGKKEPLFSFSITRKSCQNPI